MLGPKFSPFLTSNRWVGQGGETLHLLKRNFYFGELPKFQFVLGDGPIKKWLITIKIIHLKNKKTNLGNTPI